MNQVSENDVRRALRLLNQEVESGGPLGRRRLLKLALLGASAALLPGCSLTGDEDVQAWLRRISRWNDGAQAALLRPGQRALTYPAREVSTPFRFNAFYSEASVPDIDEASWRLKVGGLVGRKDDWRLDQLRALAPSTEVTRLICIEGWSAIGQWTGIPLHHFLALIGADTSAKYVGFTCADGYYTSIDMASAMHPQTMLAFGFGGAGRLPDALGFPLRLRIPIKLGFKNPKHVTGLTVSNEFTSGYWEDLHGYNWFAGL